MELGSPALNIRVRLLGECQVCEPAGEGNPAMLGTPGLGTWTWLQEHVLFNEKRGAMDTGPVVK